MHCPNCGNGLVTKGKFCPYCGSQIPEDIFIKIDSKQEIFDHARVEEAKGEGKAKVEKEKTKRRYGCLVVFLAIIAGFVILTAIALNNDKQVRITRATTTSSSSSASSSDDYFAERRAKHDKEVERLQKIEDEILEDIRNKDYEQALIKAQTLYYTDSWSNDAKKGWDNKRTALIKQLNELLGKEDTADVETDQ